MLQVGSRFNSMDRPFARHPAAAATAAVTLTVNQLSMPVPPSPSSTSNTAAAAAATAKSNQSRHSHLFMLQNSSEPGSPIAPATRASAGSGTADPSWQKFESLSLDDSDIYKGNNITVSSSADQRVSDNLLLNGPSPTSLAAPGDNAWKAVGSTGRSPPRMTGFGKDSSYEQLSQQHHHQLQDAQQQRYYQQSSLASAMTMSTPASMASSVSTLPTLDAGSIIFDTEDVRVRSFSDAPETTRQTLDTRSRSQSDTSNVVSQLYNFQSVAFQMQQQQQQQQQHPNYLRMNRSEVSPTGLDFLETSTSATGNDDYPESLLYFAEPDQAIYNDLRPSSYNGYETFSMPPQQHLHHASLPMPISGSNGGAYPRQQQQQQHLHHQQQQHHMQVHHQQQQHHYNQQYHGNSNGNGVPHLNGPSYGGSAPRPLMMYGGGSNGGNGHGANNNGNSNNAPMLGFGADYPNLSPPYGNDFFAATTGNSNQQQNSYVDEEDILNDMYEMNTQPRVQSMPDVGSLRHIEYYLIEFKAGRRASYHVEDNRKQAYKVDDYVIVEADRGKDLGRVVEKGQQCADGDSKTIIRLAYPPEIALMPAKTQEEMRALLTCQNKIRQKKLPMEVVDAEYQWDRRKLTFSFVADKRIDFRELVRELFKVYKTRIWMCLVDEKVVKKLVK